MGLTVVQPFRYCRKCFGLFYEKASGFDSAWRAACPAGDFHEAMGYRFPIPIHALPSPTAQNQWRICRACGLMFYDGYPHKGRCPGNSGGHRRESILRQNFVLPHDAADTSTTQTEWRYCGKCHAMFYDGYEEKGRCSGGDGHVAQGHVFVLPHE